MKYLILPFIVILAFLLISCEKEYDLRRKIFIERDFIRFDLLHTQEIVFVTNILDNNITVTLDFDTTYFNIFCPYSIYNGIIFIPPEQTVEVNLIAKRNRVITDSVNTDIIFKIGGHSYSDTLYTTIYSFPGDCFEPEGNIVDAEYNESNNSIVFISSQPGSNLSIYYPDNHEVKSVPLNKSPKCLSISPDGKFCAVGADYYFFYIDLEQGQVLSEIPVECQIRDIVLKNNKWVYMFPRKIDNAVIHSYNLNTHEDFASNCFYTFCKSILTRDEQYIYTLDYDDPEANNSISPKDIRKYDVSEGAIDYLYDSRYHGDYQMEGNISLLFNDSYLISGNSIFTTSAISSYDIMFYKKLKDIIYPLSLTYSEYNNMILVVNTGYDNANINTWILAYDASSFNYIGKLDVSSYIKDSRVISGLNPLFVFPGSLEGSAYILSVTDNTKEKWIIQKVTL